MMPDNAQKVVILLADDNANDRAMTRKALDKNRLANDFYTVADGEELMDFLHHRGRYAPPALSPTPGLILLDLHMPKKDGWEALAEIKADSTLRRIPVVVITTSQAEEDVVRAYDLGSNSFISKPITLVGLVEAMSVLGQYWFQIVTLPETGTS
jgi:two-component system, response regulator